MPKKEEIEKQVEAMRKLGIPEDEIKDILECDYKIEHNEPLFELPEELKPGAKKARQAERKAPVAPTKRERKADETKRFLIELLTQTLEPHCDKAIEVTNPEREFIFEYSGIKYKITLAKPRN